MPPPDPALLRRQGRFDRALRIGPLEGIGIPLLALLPLLALTGRLGPSNALATGQADIGSGRVELAVEHPDTLRHRAAGQLRVVVTNRSAQDLRDLVLLIDDHYLGRFATAEVGAMVRPLPGGQLGIPLPDLRAGEHAGVRVALTAGDWGRWQGWVGISRAGAASTERLRFSTVVLP